MRAYLHGDHLGSASLATDGSGAVVGEMRYTPYGVTRSGDVPTDFRFTGQRAESFGLYDYGARFYSPGLGRFVSADTVVPEPGNPQALNRYAYVLNSPLKYTDPSGHALDPGDWGDFELTPPPPPHLLSGELWLYAQQAAWEFDLPPEFVAAVVWAEQEYDYGQSDAIEDSMARVSLLLIEAQEITLGASWPSFYAGDSGAGDAGWQGWVILGAIEGLDSSLGVGQVRLSTAQEVTEYAISERGMTGDWTTALPTRELVERLEDPQWNVRYVAGYLRKLADLRSAEELTVQEMQILYGAYRTGPDAQVSQGVRAIELLRPGDLGSLLSPAVITYYHDLLSNYE